MKRNACRLHPCWPSMLLSMAVLFTGCTTPNRAPEPSTDDPIGPSRWTGPQDGAFVVQKAWWKAMGDPVLDRLIVEATSQNLDLTLLVDRTRRAEIELTGAKADQWPKLSATGGYTAVYTESIDLDNYAIGAGLGWELDIWGRLRDKKGAQLLEYQATEADWRAGYLLVVGGVSRTYIFLRQLDEQQQLHEQTITVARGMLDLYQQQQAAGVAASDAVARQQAEVLRLESQLEEMAGRRKLLLNELALLSGKEPGTVTMEPADLRNTMRPIVLPEQIQANLLQRRPDLVAAELRVKSAYRMQESMRAARWPQVPIGVGTSTDPASLFASQWVALITPQISFPSLDPQTKVRLQLSEVDLESAQKQYKQAVLEAINEVASAMVTLRQHEVQLANEAKRLDQFEAIRETVRRRVDAGVSNRVELLGAELNQLAVQQRQLDLYGQLLLDQVNLHNALGGGW
ncbi:MAG: TolC family protein [Phycisphaerales bacterium]|nr:MAG: TolC family protein [Phycisphaerales bacterium]